MNRRRRTPTFESLESRELLSWTPATVPYGIPAPAGGFNMVNGWNSSGTVQNGHYTYWVFTPEHSGQYNFKVTATATPVQAINGTINEYMAPIFALYNSQGIQQWHCSNGAVTSVNTNANLTQGQKYEFAVCNLTGYFAGNFNVSVASTSNYIVNVNNNDGAGCTAGAEAYLNGNTLTMWLYAFNSSTWYRYDTHTDYFTVDFENANNQILSWQQVSCTTHYGQSFNKTRTFDIGGFNLNGFTHIRAFLN